MSHTATSTTANGTVFGVMWEAIAQKRECKTSRRSPTQATKRAGIVFVPVSSQRASPRVVTKRNFDIQYAAEIVHEQIEQVHPVHGMRCTVESLHYCDFVILFTRGPAQFIHIFFIYLFFNTFY